MSDTTRSTLVGSHPHVDPDSVEVPSLAPPISHHAGRRRPGALAMFVGGRLLHGLIVVTGVLVAVFIAMRTFTDPVSELLPLDASDEARETLRQSLGLDRSLGVQSAEFAGDAVRLDFGESWTAHRSARKMVLERLPNTMLLVGLSMAIAIMLSLFVGILSALRPRGLIDRMTMVLSTIALAVPQFWLGLVLILFFAVNLGVLPSSGMGGWKHLVLPVATLALPAVGRLALVLRSSLGEELHKPYVTMSRARGLPRRHVVGYAVRNVMVTYTSMTGYEVARTLAGHAVVVEIVFAWPGVGSLLVGALGDRDLPLIQACVACVAVLVVLLNVGVDLLYRVIDPRIGSRGAQSNA